MQSDTKIRKLTIDTDRVAGREVFDSQKINTIATNYPKSCGVLSATSISTCSSNQDSGKLALAAE